MLIHPVDSKPVTNSGGVIIYSQTCHIATWCIFFIGDIYNSLLLQFLRELRAVNEGSEKLVRALALRFLIRIWNWGRVSENNKILKRIKEEDRKKSGPGVLRMTICLIEFLKCLILHVLWNLSLKGNQLGRQ